MAFDDDDYDENEQLEAKTGFARIKPHIALILAILVVFLFYGRYGTSTFDNALLWAAAILMLNYGGQAMDMSFKNATHKMIMNPLHDTTDGNYVAVGGYAIFRRGAIDAFGFHTKGGAGTIVVPEACINHYGRNVALNVRVERCALNELAPDVIATVLKQGFKEPYYQGLVDDNLIMHVPHIKFTINELLQRNKENKMLRDVLDAKYKDVETWVSAARRIGEKSKKGWASSARDQLTGGG